jgi:hypothetical protein
VVGGIVSHASRQQPGEPLKYRYYKNNTPSKSIQKTRGGKPS